MMQYIDTTHDGVTLSTAYTVVDSEVTFERVMLCQHNLHSLLSHDILDEVEAEIHKRHGEKVCKSCVEKATNKSAKKKKKTSNNLYGSGSAGNYFSKF